MFYKHTVRFLFFDCALVLITFRYFHAVAATTAAAGYVIIRRFEEMIMRTAGGCSSQHFYLKPFRIFSTLDGEKVEYGSLILNC